MMRLRRGVDPDLEDAANAILFPELKKITRPGDRDVLTHYMETSRRRREVYISDGVADAAVRRGQFNRAYNSGRPELNSRDGVAPASRNSANRINISCWVEGSWVE